MGKTFDFSKFAQDALKIKIGQRVETVSKRPDEQDAGKVLDINGSRAYIGWDSGVRTWIDVSDVKPE